MTQYLDYRFVKIQTQISEEELWGEEIPSDFQPETSSTTLDSWFKTGEEFGEGLERRTFILDDYRDYGLVDEYIQVHYEIQYRITGTKEWIRFCSAWTRQNGDFDEN